MLYFTFVLCLSFGLVGMTLFLKTLLDVLFLEWDAFADARRFFEHYRRRRYVTIGMERQAILATRANAVGASAYRGIRPSEGAGNWSAPALSGGIRDPYSVGTAPARPARQWGAPDAPHREFQFPVTGPRIVRLPSSAEAKRGAGVGVPA